MQPWFTTESVYFLVVWLANGKSVYSFTKYFCRLTQYHINLSIFFFDIKTMSRKNDYEQKIYVIVFFFLLWVICITTFICQRKLDVLSPHKFVHTFLVTEAFESHDSAVVACSPPTTAVGVRFPYGVKPDSQHSGWLGHCIINMWSGVNSLDRPLVSWNIPCLGMKLLQQSRYDI